MHQEQTKTTPYYDPAHEQQVVAHAAVPVAPTQPPEPSTLDYIKEFNLLIIAALVPLGLAWIGYKTMKTKSDAANREAQREAIRKEEEYAGDETVMQWARKEYTQRKDK